MIQVKGWDIGLMPGSNLWCTSSTTGSPPGSKVCLKWLEVAAYPQHWLGCQDGAKCPECGQRFSSRYVLKQHYQKEHQGTMFSCNECGRFLPISKLTAHGNSCFNRSDKLAAGICVRTVNCTEKVEFPSITLCQYHLSEYSLLRISFIN